MITNSRSFFVYKKIVLSPLLYEPSQKNSNVTQTHFRPHACAGFAPEGSFPQDELLLVGEQDCQDPRKICEGLIRSKERKDEGGVWVIKCRSDKGEDEEQGLRKTRCPQFRTTRRWLKGNRNALASFRYLAFCSLPLPSAVVAVPAFFRVRVRFPSNVIFRTFDRPDFAFVSCFALRMLPQVLQFARQVLNV